jgi:hypothetical protein
MITKKARKKKEIGTGRTNLKWAAEILLGGGVELVGRFGLRREWRRREACGSSQ